MTPVERLQAAIEKLEQQDASAARGTWLAWRSGLPGRERYGVETGEEGMDVVWGVRRASNAELIATLHRTIDAQLALLRVAVSYGDLGRGKGSRFASAAIALADAILGADS